MIIGSHVDLEQFKINGQWTAESDERLKSYADSYFSAMAEVRPALFAGICAMKGRINEKLSEKKKTAYDDILRLLHGEEYENLSQYDYELKVFKIAGKIYEIEKLMDTCIFDQIEYAEHFESIYRQMSFYFRRIQLGLARTLQTEIMMFVAEKHLSVYAVEQLILESMIGEKDKLFTTISSMYAERLSYKEAIYMLHQVYDREDLPEETKNELKSRLEELDLKLRMAKGV